jgi:surface polysaccharide O-acyltransferase-like enzyme
LSIVRNITDTIANEIRAILREYAHETEAALKKRLKRLVIMGIVTSILVSLVISLIGTADLFLTIGELLNLSTTMPMWKAFDIMGVTDGIIGGVLFVALFLIIRKQFGSS